MHSFDFGTEELRMLWASVVLGLVQVLLEAVSSAASGRFMWAFGPRDMEGHPLSKVAGRLERAWKNYLQTFPLFAALVLLANSLNRHSNMTALGAELYFYARVVYVPLYALGIPFVRTAIWWASIVGIVFVLIGREMGCSHVTNRSALAQRIGRITIA